MIATINLPSDCELLTAALEGLTAVNEILIERGDVPADPRDAGIYYKTEATGLEEWNDATLVIKQGWGDCEDLAAWEAARMRTSGEDEGARVIIIEPGRPGRYHAVVETSDGEIVDICLELGMKARRRSVTSSSSTDVSGVRTGPARQNVMQRTARNLILRNRNKTKPKGSTRARGDYSNRPPATQPMDPFEQALLQAQAMQSSQPSMSPAMSEQWDEGASDAFGDWQGEAAAEDPMEWMNPNDTEVDDSVEDMEG